MLCIKSDRAIEATISYCRRTGWTVTFQSYSVCSSVSRTCFGVPIWKCVFDPVLEVVPGQKLEFDVCGFILTGR